MSLNNRSTRQVSACVMVSGLPCTPLKPASMLKSKESMVGVSFYLLLDLGFRRQRMGYPTLCSFPRRPVNSLNVYRRLVTTCMRF
jgi:hypothetical protein